MSILFNQSAGIQFGYFGKFKFVDRQRAHRETFCDEPMIFLDNPTKQKKPMVEKELYE